MMTKKTTKTVKKTFRLTDELNDWIEKECEKQHRTFSNYLNNLLLAEKNKGHK